MKQSSSQLITRAEGVLREHFGYSSFRLGQAEIIESITTGHDTLAVMPTGGGKSLCYQIPALLSQGTALVISPLIALMKDQVDALKRARVPATEINSSLHIRELQQRMTNAKFGAYKLLYVAPERLESAQFLEQLREVNISFLAVDEAHCISEWGHDFRPSYRNIPEALATLARVPIIALTATATAEVRTDIVRSLSMNDAATFVKGFDRPNLRYHTEYCENKIARVAELVQQTPSGSVIIYAGSRRKVEETSEVLQRMGHAAGAYHAGMPDAQRKETQEKFLCGDVRVLAATSAFGMGVDKPDVRHVVHTELTLTLEAYYQEAGRAGRDGLESVCTALYHPRDRELQEYFLRNMYPAPEFVKSVYTYLYDMAGVAVGSKAMAPVYADDTGIGNRLNMPAPVVSGVLNVLERAQVIRRGPRNAQARLHLTADPERIREYFRHTTNERRAVLEMLLRGVGPEALRASVSVDVQHLSRKHDIPFDACVEALRAFEFARILRYEPASGSGGIVLMEMRASANRIPYDAKSLETRHTRALEKLDEVVRYMETDECKRTVLLRYFDDVVTEPCGRCSSCIADKSGSTFAAAQPVSTEEQQHAEEKILQAVAELGERFGRTTVAAVLVGESTSTVERFDLSRSTFFACLREQSVSSVVESIDRLIRSGVLSNGKGDRPVVSITAKGRLLLGEDVPAPLAMPVAMTGRAAAEQSSTAQNTLLGNLQRVRTELASRYSIPARSVATDEQLKALAENKPATPEECALIRGIGRVFLERYAREFLAVIGDQHQSDATHSAEDNLTARQRELLQLVREGYDVSRIAANSRTAVGSLAAELQDMIMAGVDVPPHQLVPARVVASVRKELQKNPRAMLKDLRAAIGPESSPAELRIAAAYVRRERQRLGG
ncbi:MAG: hypothetical protein RL156_1461 [Bacteroidota bacterium]